MSRTCARDLGNQWYGTQGIHNPHGRAVDRFRTGPRGHRTERPVTYPGDEMFVQLGVPDCDPRSYGIRDASAEPVDAFWVECTPEEAATLVEPRMSDADRMSIDETKAHYGWPHHFEGLPRCCFLVARDLSFIHAFHAHYPFHQLWNGYSPFRDVPDTAIGSLEGLSALPKPS